MAVVLDNPPSVRDRAAPVADERVREVCQTVEVRCPLWVSDAHFDSRVFAELAVAQTRPGQRVLDLGTGTGIVAICLAKTGCEVEAADVSASAVRIARANAEQNGVAVRCHRSDLLAAVEGRFDLIAFSPPYNFRPDSVSSDLAKNLLRRVPWLRRNCGQAMPRAVVSFRREIVARLFEQAPDHLEAGGAVLLHVFESEIETLSDLAPPGTDVMVLDHPDLETNRTAGLLVTWSNPKA